jgi:hypothetical protein
MYYNSILNTTHSDRLQVRVHLIKTQQIVIDINTVTDEYLDSLGYSKIKEIVEEFPLNYDTSIHDLVGFVRGSLVKNDNNSINNIFNEIKY